MKCSKCGNEVQENWAMCPFCGTTIEKKTLCAKCGAELQPNWAMCPFCGQQVNAAPSTQSVSGQASFGNASILPRLEDLSGILPDDFALDLVADDIAEAQQRQKDEEAAAYKQKLDLARVYCIRKMYTEAKAIYEELIAQNFSDVNAYIGLVRVVSQNFTVLEGKEIDEAIDVAKQIAGKAIDGLDTDLDSFVSRRKAHFEEIAEAERKRKEAEATAKKAKAEAERKRKAEIESNYQRGCELYDADQYSAALSYFIGSAEQGNSDAQFRLGYCYHMQKDYAKAVEWYTKAANQGHDKAQNNLGFCYKHGQGVVQNYAKAVEWYTKAANQGFARAQNDLGACYHNGQGVAQSYSTARYWYKKAADQGHELAKHNLKILEDE